MTQILKNLYPFTSILWKREGTTQKKHCLTSEVAKFLSEKGNCVSGGTGTVPSDTVAESEGSEATLEVQMTKAPEVLPWLFIAFLT